MRSYSDEKALFIVDDEVRGIGTRLRGGMGVSGRDNSTWCVITVSKDLAGRAARIRALYALLIYGVEGVHVNRENCVNKGQKNMPRQIVLSRSLYHPHVGRDAISRPT